MLNNRQSNTFNLSGHGGFSRTLTHFFVVFLLGGIIYSNTMRVPFVVDDERYIFRNPVVHDMRGFVDREFAEKLIHQRLLDQNFRTRIVTFFSFALNFRLHGYNLAGYHLVNLLVHLLNGLLVYQLMQLTLRTPFAAARESWNSGTFPHIAALSTALLFVCHPVQTQAVTYISQRFTSLSTMFYLAAIVAYITWRIPDKPGVFSNMDDGISGPARKRPLLFGLAVASALLAMFSKEISFTLPLTIALYEYLFFSGNLQKRFLFILPFLVTMLAIPLTVFGNKAKYEDIVNLTAALNGEGQLKPLHYLYTQFTVLITYLRLLVLPVNQNIDHFQPVYKGFFQLPVLLSAFLLVLLLGLGIHLFSRSKRTMNRQGLWLRVVSFGIFWFFLTNSIESTILPLDDLIFEHRVYLPSIGFFLALSALVEIIRSKVNKAGGIILSMAMVFLILGWSGATYARNTVWRDNLVLWSDAAAKSPGNFRPHLVLGRLLKNERKYAEATQELETAVRINPLSLDGWSELAGVYIEQGNNEMALLMLDKAALGVPKNRDSLDALASRYLQIDRFAEAEDILRKAIRLNSENALLGLGSLYMRQGRFDESVEVLSRARSLAPDNGDISYYLGLVRIKKGDYAGASEDLQRALLLNPEDKKAREKLEYVWSILKGYTKDGQNDAGFDH